VVLGVAELPLGGRVAHFDGALELPSPGAAVAAVACKQKMHGGDLAALPVEGVPGAAFLERISGKTRRHLEASGEGGNSARGPEAGAAVVATVDHTLGVVGKQCDVQGHQHARQLGGG